MLATDVVTVAANAAATAMNAVTVAVSVATVAMVARAAMVPVQSRLSVKMHPVKPMQWTTTLCARMAIQATQKVARKAAKAAAAVVDADVDAVTSAAHARMARSSSPAPPKADKPNWDLSIPSQRPMMRKTARTPQHLLKAATTTANPVKNVHVTAMAVIAARAEIAPNARTNLARTQTQPQKPSPHSSQLLNVPLLLQHLQQRQPSQQRRRCPRSLRLSCPRRLWNK